MPFNGAGAYSPPGADFPAVALTLIESAHFNNVINDIATALSTCITKDGQTTITQNLPMGGFKHTGVTATAGVASRTEYAAAGVVQDSSLTWGGTVGGTADAITVTLAPPITVYAAGQSFTYKSGAGANTGAMTVAVSGLATKAIQKRGAALVANDHAANSWFRITYDGAAFQLEQIEPQDTTRRTAAIAYVFDGGVAALTTGIKGDLRVPFACTIQSVSLLADQAGSIVFDIWKDTYANYPPTVADTITAAAKPTIVTATKSEDLVLTGWTKTIAAGDTLRFNIDSITTLTRCVLTLNVLRT